MTVSSTTPTNADAVVREASCRRSGGSMCRCDAVDAIDAIDRLRRCCRCLFGCSLVARRSIAAVSILVRINGHSARLYVLAEANIVEELAPDRNNCECRHVLFLSALPDPQERASVVVGPASRDGR